MEVYYNSRQFVYTMELLEKQYADAFAIYEALAVYYERSWRWSISQDCPDLRFCLLLSARQR